MNFFSSFISGALNLNNQFLPLVEKFKASRFQTTSHLVTTTSKMLP